MAQPPRASRTAMPWTIVIPCSHADIYKLDPSHEYEFDLQANIVMAGHYSLFPGPFTHNLLVFFMET